MPTSLKTLLGGAPVELGGTAWFADSKNPLINPVYKADTAVYLRSGNIAFSDEYAKAADAFGEQVLKGRDWLRVPAPFGDDASYLSFGPTLVAGVYVATNRSGSMVVSSDSGITWSKPFSPLNGEKVYEVLEIAPSVLLACGYDANLVSLSSDAGFSWSAPFNPFSDVTSNAPEGANIDTGYLPTESGSCLATCSVYDPATDSYAFYVSNSIDAGKTWSNPVEPSAPLGVANASIIYGGGALVAFCVDENNMPFVSRSLDLGLTWSSPPVGGQFVGSAIGYSSNIFEGNLLVCWATNVTESGKIMIVSSDFGVTWTSPSNPLGDNTEIDEVKFVSGAIVVCGKSGQYLPRTSTSVDQGVTWTTPYAPEVGGGDFRCFASKGDACAMVGGAVDSVTGAHLFVSVDRGVSWTMSSVMVDVRDILFVPIEVEMGIAILIWGDAVNASPARCHLYQMIIEPTQSLNFVDQIAPTGEFVRDFHLLEFSISTESMSFVALGQDNLNETRAHFMNIGSDVITADSDVIGVDGMFETVWDGTSMFVFPSGIGIAAISTNAVIVGLRQEETNGASVKYVRVK